jgi:hypothetical protein
VVEFGDLSWNMPINIKKFSKHRKELVSEEIDAVRAVVAEK